MPLAEVIVLSSSTFNISEEGNVQGEATSEDLQYDVVLTIIAGYPCHERTEEKP